MLKKFTVATRASTADFRVGIRLNVIRFPAWNQTFHHYDWFRISFSTRFMLPVTPTSTTLSSDVDIPGSSAIVLSIRRWFRFQQFGFHRVSPPSRHDSSTQQKISGFRKAFKNYLKPCTSPKNFIVSVKGFFPIITWLSAYQKSWFLSDMIAGVVIAILHVPQGSFENGSR